MPARTLLAAQVTAPSMEIGTPRSRVPESMEIGTPRSQVPEAPATTTSLDDRSQSFRPVQGGGEMQSGEKLLVEAYSAIWLLVFGMILLSWRRQRQIERRVDALDASLQAARDPSTWVESPRSRVQEDGKGAG